ncbi:uncharacterized protein [Hetaerina americana]|uniref:uncharacterized protein n=1 Tax=Hetaerina americana TaxID=62018 RepID=UPI003A7F4AC5
MSLGTLRGIYLSSPPKTHEPLPPAPTVTRFNWKEQPVEENQPTEECAFQIPDWVKKLIEGGKPSPADHPKDPQVSHTSNDGRLYVATRALPGRPGAYGSVSMSGGAGDDMRRGSPPTIQERGGEDARRNATGRNSCRGEQYANHWQQAWAGATQHQSVTTTAPQHMRRGQSSESRHVREIMECAKEQIQSDSNHEFNQKLASMRENVKQDLSRARTKYQWARWSYEMAKRAREQAIEEKETALVRNVNALLNKLDALESRNVYLLDLIEKGMLELYETRRHVRDIKASRARELNDLEVELRMKQLYLADMM